MISPKKVARVFSLVSIFFLFTNYTAPLLNWLDFSVQAEEAENPETKNDQNAIHTAAIEAPTNLGWNTEENHPGDPGWRDSNGNPEITCGGITSSNSVSHNWTAVPEAVQYERRVYYPGIKEKSFYETNNHTPFATFGGSTPIQGEWNTQVRALDSDGWGEWSNECQITHDSIPPFAEVTSHNDGDTVTGVVTVKGTVTDANPHHYWAVVHNSSGHKVAGPGTVNESNEFTDKELFTWNTYNIPAGKYTIKLEARDAADNKKPNQAPVPTDPNDPTDSIDWIEVNVPEQTPDAPLFWVEEDSTSAKVEWRSVANATGYNIYRDGAMIASVSSSETTYIDNAAGSYTYEVRATNAHGESTPQPDSVKYSTTFDIVIDDDSRDADFNSDGTVSASSGWIKYDMSSWPELIANGVGGDLYGTNGAHGQTFEWTTNNTINHNAAYEVWVSYLCNSPRPVANYEIYSGNNLVGTGSVDQSHHPTLPTECNQFTQNTEVWAKVGTYALRKNKAATVKLISPSGVGGNVLADAVAFKETGTIQGRKFNDLNGNGNNDSGTDPKLDDWMIYLFDGSWNMKASMSTGDDLTPAGNVGKGQYRFVNLDAGTYYVCEEYNSSWVQTRPESGITPPAGVGVALAEKCFTINLKDGHFKGGVQFGNFRKAAIGGHKWEDENYNGTEDTGESRLEGWNIELRDEAMVIISEQETDSLGSYKFTGLTVGTYYVCEEERENWIQTYPNSLDGCHEIFIDNSGIIVDNVDFGNYLNSTPSVNITASPRRVVNEGTRVTLTASISGGDKPFQLKSWSGDCSGSANTYRLPGQPGIYRCTYTIIDLDGETASDSITVTVNEEESGSGGGNDDNNQGGDNDDTTAPQVTDNVSSPGEVILGAQAQENTGLNENTETKNKGTKTTKDKKDGEVLGTLDCEKTNKVSGYVYLDNNNDEKKGDDEKGLKNVEITVYFEQEGEEIVVEKVKTDENGYWEADVCPGEYKARINTDDLPEKMELRGDKIITLNVPEDDVVENINYSVKELKSFDWKVLCWGALIFVLLALAYAYLSSKKKKDSRRQQ